MNAVEGLFETVYVRNGTALRLDEHLGRLLRSAKVLGLPMRDDPAEVRRRCEGLPDGRLRLALAGGHVTVSVAPFPGYPEDLYRTGATAVLASQPGHPLGDRAGHKSLPYEVMIAAKENAGKRGATEVLFTAPDGAILEGSVSNVFVRIGGTLITPPLTRPILPGVTRAAVLALAPEWGVGAREADIFPADLERAEEAFLTSSLMLAMPLRKIGAVEIPTSGLAEGFRKRLA